MTIAQQIFAVAPAIGAANLTPAQSRLLVGKAKWVAAVAAAGQPVTPTVCLTRAAWTALKQERQSESHELRAIWVAALFKLVHPHEPPPLLAVRTSAARHNAGLMRARTDIVAPSKVSESVDTKMPLAKAIEQAFESYALTDSVWTDAGEQQSINEQIVIVQAMAEGALTSFYTRDLKTGDLGPVPVPGEGSADLPANAGRIAEAVDEAVGTHTQCLVAIQKGQAVLLSARVVQASVAAELEALLDRVERGYLSPRQAVDRLDIARLPQILHPSLAPDVKAKAVATGIGVSPGAASGEIVFSSEDAARCHARGKHCILVATETGPGDIEGMTAATGILTARGGHNSHAAIIARVSGKPCVAGVRSLQVDGAELTCQIGGQTFRSGDQITIDGSDGRVFSSMLALSQPHLGGAVGKLLGWSDGTRTIAVRTNVETVASAETALSFGAEGIGLARSEHMFFTPERLVALRRLILSESESDRSAALSGLVDFQSGDYAELFSTMVGKPVTVRLFDPPLHEFLPRTDDDIEETAASLGLPVNALRQRLERLAEVNPMLGHRGCRLAISHPEILEMQIHALFAGARAAEAKTSEPVDLEIMVPFVTSSKEVAWIRSEIRTIAQREAEIAGRLPQYAFGTMIELPRAALRAGEIAPLVDFFSFGTNDLTQTTFGISRDDAPAFMASYKRKGIYDEDPFTTVDKRGVGELIKIATERGRAANPDLKIGICGEHAGDPASIAFFASLGIDYVSCAPYRVPIARLALAQAQK